MEWKSNLRGVQSQRSVHSSCDKPTWREAGLRDRTASVSKLVTRYQTTVEVSTSTQETRHADAKPQQMLKEITSPLVERKETHLESLMRRNEERERSRVRTNLTRSKSMGSLQNSAGSIGALKALFESKAATRNNTRSSFTPTRFTSPIKAGEVVRVMNGEVEEIKSSVVESKTQMPADAPVNDAKDGHVTRKMVNPARMERRKTIGGIDFEKVAASQADEKRRSIADFRDSSFLQTKEKPCVSVKAMSALYLSKVAPRESTSSPLKQAQDQSYEPGKRVKPTKMAEDPQHGKDDPPTFPPTRHQSGPEDVTGAQSVQSQLSKERLYEQRQKCELRRLLKHTNPELKMLDEAVDEELAEVLSSETGVTAGETGYEGEVLSRCLIFENCTLSGKVSPYTSKIHAGEEAAERGDFSKTSALFEGHEGKACNQSVKGIVEDEKMLDSSLEPNRECEGEIRRDVQATRRIFESQSVNTSRLNPHNKFQGKVSISGEETTAAQKQKQELEMCSKENLHGKNKSDASTKSLDLTDKPYKQGPFLDIIGQEHEFPVREEVFADETDFRDEPTSLPDPEECGEIIKTSAALFQNNPFISTNVQREQILKPQSVEGVTGSAQESLIANVKNRAHLFESMPFDKIRHQNKDEIETMVENIKETLNRLFHGNVIHSGGSIIEVHETMIAKKAKFTLSESGPEINYDEVAEGGAQNFILQLLPRANLKNHITYLKEDSKGSMEATVVHVPVHQHHFTTHQDTEFKTANVVQVVEDILNQDNSLRKGVIIQEDVDRCAEVIVYSLYNYFDEEDVKRYCPPQDAELGEPEPEQGDVSKIDNQELRRGLIKSTISCLMETSRDQTGHELARPEITAKGNVRLFKSCIEKGDLAYLKSLQAEPTEQEQELQPNQNVGGQDAELPHEQRGDKVEEGASEWVPVDVKRLKTMFSGDQKPVQPKQNAYEYLAQSSAISGSSTSQNAPTEKSKTSAEKAHMEHGGKTQESSKSTAAPQGSYPQLVTQDDDRVHQAELVEVVEDNDEIFNLQNAIYSLQQATKEAKSLHHSLQEKRKSFTQESTKEPFVSVTTDNVKHSRIDAEFPQENEDQKEWRWEELPSASNITSEHKLDRQQENTKTSTEDTNSEEVQATEGCCKDDHEGTEFVQTQHFKAAVVHSSEMTAAPQEDEEVVFEGKLQAALDSLEKSNFNVTRGDFRAAMIYKNSSKPHKERSQNVDEMSVEQPTKEFCPVTEHKSAKAPLRQEVSKEHVAAAKAELPNQCETLNKPLTSAVLEKSRRPAGPKPSIPPKPEHLTVKQRDVQSTSRKNPEAIKTNTVKHEGTVPQTTPVTSASHQDEHNQDLLGIKNSQPVPVSPQTKELFDGVIEMSQEAEVRHQVQGSLISLGRDNTDENIINATVEKKSPQDCAIKENMNETDESHVDFHEACKKFGGKKAPVKPKRVKIAKPDSKSPKHTTGDDNSSVLTHVVQESQQNPTGPLSSNTNTCGQTADSKDKHMTEIKEENKVEMREKKGRAESEDERRQRLSVHMDEIMRGNITAAMEIFDNLRKQEELQSILSRVEEIEEDTSEVDVRSLRRVFEDVPDWVVRRDGEKQKKVENKEERLPLTRDSTENKSPMAHVFGDLERASEEIMNLKEQTLSRLMDIEEAIKKALYSVSTLKCDSDIAGLSSLFKESLGTVQVSQPSGNISKISIGSSRTKPLLTQGNPTALPVNQSASAAKRRASPPSSPAFISIQSAARKTNKAEVLPEDTKVCPTCQHSPKTEETFRTTKTLTCNSPAQDRKKDPRKGGKKPSSNLLTPKRELSVFEVQTDHGGNSVTGTKTVTENYERTDSFGNRFYSSKTSTVITAPPENTTSTAFREMCSACLKPVYPMEKITTDKYIFHKTCFCCKQCKKKLSMYNYAPLYGDFYCIFHYQQLFRRKGNYDEGFGYTQHKNRWLLQNTDAMMSNESEA